MSEKFPSGLVVDTKNHAYYLDGKRLFSVTERLAGMGIIDQRWYTPEGRVRGKATHTACSFIEGEGLDWESLKDTEKALSVPISPYVRAWEKFLKETGWKSELIEQPFASELYQFAGTPDRVGTFRDGTPAILDIKTGSYLAWHDLQLGGYDVLVPNPTKKLRKLFVIELHDNESYRPVEITDLDASNIFLSFNCAHAWGIYKGLLVDHREEVKLPENFTITEVKQGDYVARYLEETDNAIH